MDRRQIIVSALAGFAGFAAVALGTDIRLVVLSRAGVGELRSAGRLRLSTIPARPSPSVRSQASRRRSISAGRSARTFVRRRCGHVALDQKTRTRCREAQLRVRDR